MSVWRTKHKLWVLPLPTGSPRHLSNIVAHWGVWSPDGRQLAFAKGSDIFLANADGTNARKLVTVSGSAFSIRFSPMALGFGSRSETLRPTPPRFGKFVPMAAIFIAFSLAGTTHHRSLAAAGVPMAATTSSSAAQPILPISGLCVNLRDCFTKRRQSPCS